MKVFTIISLMCLAVGLYAQTTDKQPRWLQEDGFFGTKYYLGEKRVTPKELRLHLDKTDTDASYLFRRSNQNGNSAAIWYAIGTIGMLGGLISEEPAPKLVWYSSAVVSYSFALGFTIGGNSKERKAKMHYNLKYGYQ